MTAARLLRDRPPEFSAIRTMFTEGNALRERYGSDGVLNLSLGDPTRLFQLSAEAESAISAAARGDHGYGPVHGIPQLRELAAGIERRFGPPVSLDDIIITHGACGAMNVVFGALRDGEVLVPDPYFLEFRGYLGTGKHLRPVRTRPDFRLDPEAVAAAVTGDTVAIILNTPHNPTALMYAAGELTGIGDLLRHRQREHGQDILLVIDETYRDIVLAPAGALGIHENAVAVSSFSKSLLIPGERIGYLAVNPACPARRELLEAFTAEQRVRYVNTCVAGQRAVLALQHHRPDFAPMRRAQETAAAMLSGAGYDVVPPDMPFYPSSAPPSPTTSPSPAT